MPHQALMSLRALETQWVRWDDRRVAAVLPIIGEHALIMVSHRMARCVQAARCRSPRDRALVRAGARRRPRPGLSVVPAIPYLAQCQASFLTGYGRKIP